MSDPLCPSEYVTTVNLPPHPPIDVDAGDASKIYFGVDSLVTGLNSYHVTLSQILAAVGASSTGTSSSIVEAPAHGIPPLAGGGIPLPVYVDSAGTLQTASSDAIETLPQAYIVGIESPNAVRLQVTGVQTVPVAHGLIVGETYYLQPDGTLATSPAGKYEVPCFVVTTSETMVLLRLDPRKVPVKGVDFRYDLADPGALYYGVETTDGQWAVERYTLPGLGKMVATGGYASLSDAWPNRLTLTYV